MGLMSSIYALTPFPVLGTASPSHRSSVSLCQGHSCPLFPRAEGVWPEEWEEELGLRPPVIPCRCFSHFNPTDTPSPGSPVCSPSAWALASPLSLPAFSRFVPLKEPFWGGSRAQ